MLPRIKKFILKFHGVHEPVYFSLKDIPGIIMYGIVLYKKEVKSPQEKCTDSMSVVLNKVISERDTRSKFLVSFSHYYDQVFKHTLYEWAKASQAKGQPAIHGIKDFLEYYEISEDDYPFLTAHRAWQRHLNGEYTKDMQSA